MPVFRRSIWNPPKEYDLRSQDFTRAAVKVISRLGWVDAAKKQAPPLAAKALIAIGRAIDRLPRAREVKSEQIESYLQEGIKHLGAGIPVLVCMLAVKTSGDYPPIDRKVTTGLLALDLVTATELKSLNGKSISKFSRVYVATVIPAWIKIRKLRSPQDADEYWASSGQARR